MVRGSANLPAFSASGEPRPGVGTGQFDGKLSDFAGYELVGPRWTVTFDAPVQGSHPTNDPVFDAVSRLGQVERRSMPPDGVVASYGRATYEVTVLAVDADEARRRVVDALAAFEAIAGERVAIRQAP